MLYTSFYEASTRDACISKMRLTIDSFSIEVDIDSSRKAVVTIPQTLSGERVDILLIDFKGDTFHLEAVNIGEGDIVFSHGHVDLGSSKPRSPVLQLEQLHPLSRSRTRTI